MHYVHPGIETRKNRIQRPKNFLKKEGNSLVASLTKDRHENVLYLCPFFPEIKIDALTFDFAHFEIDWDDGGLKNCYKEKLGHLKNYRHQLFPKVISELQYMCVREVAQIKTFSGT